MPFGNSSTTVISSRPMRPEAAASQMPSPVVWVSHKPAAAISRATSAALSSMRTVTSVGSRLSRQYCRREREPALRLSPCTATVSEMDSNTKLPASTP